MKFARNIAVAAVSAATLLGASNALAASATAQAGGKIIAALTIAKTQDLYFGSIVPSADSADTVVIGTDNTRTCGANLTCVGTDNTQAAFTVTGEDGYSYGITLPATATLTNTDGDTMNVDAFTSDKSGNAGTLSGGSDTINVGARLNVDAAQATGAYTGSFSVEVAYQ